MARNVDRATGAFFLVFGLLLYFVIIPVHVEFIEGGWILPETIPNAVAIVLGVCGALLMLKPTIQRVQSSTEFLNACLYFGLLAVGLFIMSHVGFVYAAPLIALVLMLLIGERRPLWLGLGVVAVPAVIWVMVVQVLDRPLP